MCPHSQYTPAYVPEGGSRATHCNTTLALLFDTCCSNLGHKSTSRADTMAARSLQLLGLPPELRTWIYSLHFTDETITLQEPNHCVNIAGTEQWKIITQATAPGLLLSNKQIYGEAISLYYSCLTLKICPLREWDTGGADRFARDAGVLTRRCTSQVAPADQQHRDRWRSARSAQLFGKRERRRAPEEGQDPREWWRRMLAANDISIQPGIVRHQA